MDGLRLRDIVGYLEGKVITGEQFLDKNVVYGFASDLMSDVLTIDKDQLVLITGLTNIQTLRTAEMSDIRYIIFVRNKVVTEDMIEIAVDNDILIISCRFSMFKAVSILANAGLKPVY